MKTLFKLYMAGWGAAGLLIKFSPHDPFKNVACGLLAGFTWPGLAYCAFLGGGRMEGPMIYGVSLLFWMAAFLLAKLFGRFRSHTSHGSEMSQPAVTAWVRRRTYEVFDDE